MENKEARHQLTIEFQGNVYSIWISSQDEAITAIKDATKSIGSAAPAEVMLQWKVNKRDPRVSRGPVFSKTTASAAIAAYRNVRRQTGSQYIMLTEVLNTLEQGWVMVPAHQEQLYRDGLKDVLELI